MPKSPLTPSRCTSCALKRPAAIHAPARFEKRTELQRHRQQAVGSDMARASQVGVKERIKPVYLPTFQLFSRAKGTYMARASQIGVMIMWLVIIPHSGNRLPARPHTRAGWVSMFLLECYETQCSHPAQGLAGCPRSCS